MGQTSLCRYSRITTNCSTIRRQIPAEADFGRLAKWMVSFGIDRTMSPRTFATIESNVTQRVAERSLDSLYELFEAQPANPLIIAAMSLFVPTQRQGEYLAEYALARADKYPLARAYVASTFAKYERVEEAERIMEDALGAALTTPGSFAVQRSSTPGKNGRKPRSKSSSARLQPIQRMR